MFGRIKISTLPLHYNYRKLFSINVWVRISESQPILPVVLPQCNIGVCLMTFQKSSMICPFFSGNISDSCKRCPRTVRQYMNHTLGGELLGRGGSVNLPTQSSDLNPLEFWLRGFLKALLCSGSIQDL